MPRSPNAIAEPIPFIQHDPSKGGFYVTERAEQIFSSVRGTMLRTIIVAGPYRTGKSFLLNKLVGAKGGFKVGGTVNACTKGIWLWGSPITRNGVTYIFMDSEGLGSFEQEQGFDASILSLAVLLSSLFVLNTQGTITERSLEELELVAECSKRIQVEEEGKGRSLSEYFPEFIWVLRDFALQLQTEDGSPMSSKQYLEMALMPRKGKGPKIASKNRIRSVLRDLFPNRDCATLVRPVNEESKLQHLNELPMNELRKEFVRGFEKLRTQVYDAPIKTIDGTPINGRAFIQLSKAYAHAINTGGVPTIKSTWQSVMELQGNYAIESAVKLYRDEFPIDTEAMDDNELLRRHSVVETRAFQLVKDVVGDFDQKENLMKQLKEKLVPLLDERKKTNTLKSSQQSHQLFERLAHGIKLEEKGLEAGSFAARRQKLQQSYLQQAKGPAKEKILRTKLDRITANYLSELGANVESAKREAEREKEIVKSARSEINTLRDALKVERARGLDASKRFTIQSQQKDAEISGLRSELKQKESKLQLNAIELVEARTAERQRSKQVKKLQEALQSFKNRSSELSKGEEKSRQELAHMGTVVKNLRGSLSQAERALAKKDATLKELREAQEDVGKSLDDEVQKNSRLSQENAKLLEELARARNELSESRQRARDLQSKHDAEKENDMEFFNSDESEPAESEPERKHRSKRARPKPLVSKSSAKKKIKSSASSGGKAPEKMTVRALMSRLTELDVDLPPIKQKKQFYVDLLYKSDPSLA